VVLGRHNLFLQNNVQFVKSSHIYWYSYFGLGQSCMTPCASATVLDKLARLKMKATQIFQAWRSL